MFPTPTSLSEQTQKRYVSIVNRLAVTSHRRHPNSRGAELVVRVVDDLIESRPTISRSTFRLYRAAVLFVVEWKLARVPAGERGKLVSAAERLRSAGANQCLRKSSKTSAKKAKRVRVEEYELIKQYLVERATRTPLGAATAAAACIVRMTGVRPAELCRIGVELLNDGGVRVSVRNAKVTNGRGLGEQRTIYVEGLSGEDVEAFCRWSDLLQRLAPEGDTLAAVARVSKQFRRAVRAALPKRARYPSLYCLRHQFVADAKASGMGADEIAALVGHASDGTAGRHYGRRVSGSGGLKTRPEAGDVQRVRLRAKSFRPKAPQSPRR